MIARKIALVWLMAGLSFLGDPATKGISRAEGQGAPPSEKTRPSVPERESSVGVREVPRPDGGKDIIHYSVTPGSDRRAREQAEKNKLEKSLDLPGNVILLGR